MGGEPLKTILENASYLYTCDDADRAFEHGYLCIEDGRIAAVGSGRPPWDEADVRYDLDGCVVIPGFVNVHHHFYQSITRAIPLAQRAKAPDWLFVLYTLWAHLDAPAIYAATRLSIAELLLTGATTSVDHSYIHLDDGLESVDEQVRAAQELGLRYHLVRGCLPAVEGLVGDRLVAALGSYHGRLIGRGIDLLPLLERTLQKYHSHSEGRMLDVSLGPTGVVYARPDLMIEHGRMAESYNCGLHAHFHPTPYERAESFRRTGRSPVDYLSDCGWLRPGTWFAHCTELDDSDIAAFASTGCGVSHSPRTVTRLGYRVPPIAKLRRAGVAVGIGVDGAASNDSGSMLAELRLGQLLGRVNSPVEASSLEDWLTPYDLLLTATRVGAALLRRDDIGRLQPGCRADVAAFDISAVEYGGAVLDPLGALFMTGAESKAQLTMVNGSTLVWAGHLLHADEKAIRDKADEAARSMVHRAASVSGLNYSAYPGQSKGPVFMRQADQCGARHNP